MNIDPAAFWRDPYPILAEMRDSAPICYVPEIGATLITRRDDIHTCEKNVSVFSSDQPGGLMNVLMGRNMMRKDGEEHRKERFVYYPTISPRKVEQIWAGLFVELWKDNVEIFCPKAGTTRNKTTKALAKLLAFKKNRIIFAFAIVLVNFDQIFVMKKLHSLLEVRFY